MLTARRSAASSCRARRVSGRPRASRCLEKPRSAREYDRQLGNAGMGCPRPRSARRPVPGVSRAHGARHSGSQLEAERAQVLLLSVLLVAQALLLVALWRRCCCLWRCGPGAAASGSFRPRFWLQRCCLHQLCDRDAATQRHAGPAAPMLRPAGQYIMTRRTIDTTVMRILAETAQDIRAPSRC